MSIAYISWNEHIFGPVVEKLASQYKQNEGKHYRTFSESRELFAKKHDVILIRPSQVDKGVLEKDIPYEKGVKDVWGKRILTDIIRNDISANLYTPVGIILLEPNSYSQEEYLNLGANNVWFGDQSDMMHEFLREVLKKK